MSQLLACSQEHVFERFYRTPRVGALRLSDGGGPFGFDITVALQIDYIVRAARIAHIVETGTYLGDTTEFLGGTYPELKVSSIEINSDHWKIAKARCRNYSNVEIHQGNSKTVLPDILATSGDQPVLVYLDAHWENEWPLSAELMAIANVDTPIFVAIDDFDIEDSRFGYDMYGDEKCNIEYLRRAGVTGKVWTGNPHATYPYPCLQTGRRTGTAYLAPEESHALLAHPYFKLAGA